MCDDLDSAAVVLILRVITGKKKNNAITGGTCLKMQFYSTVSSITDLLTLFKNLVVLIFISLLRDVNFFLPLSLFLTC